MHIKDVNWMWVFTFPFTSTLILQQGVTPVMLAAAQGHTGVVGLLVHKYSCSLTEVNTVSAFDVLGCQSSVVVSCQCLCPAFSVECQSACSQHLCRMYGRRK